MEQPHADGKANGINRVIYSCSGIGSNVGQLANAAACRLASEGFGSGSCFAGISGGTSRLIDIAKHSDERLVIDGCQAACAKEIMDAQDIPVDRYVIITDLGIEKIPGPDFRIEDVEIIIGALKQQ